MRAIFHRYSSNTKSIVVTVPTTRATRTAVHCSWRSLQFIYLLSPLNQILFSICEFRSKVDVRFSCSTVFFYGLFFSLSHPSLFSHSISIFGDKHCACAPVLCSKSDNQYAIAVIIIDNNTFLLCGGRLQWRRY